MLSKFSVIPNKQLNETSNDFKIFFLLEFTRALIESTKPTEFFQLKDTLREEEKEQREEEIGVFPEIIKEQVKQELKPKKEQVLTRKKLLPIPSRKPVLKIIPKRKSLRKKFIPIPRSAPKLPPRLQYLRPIPRNVQIDLGPLNSFIQDPMVRSIECNGTDQNLIVRGNMGSKKTNIILGKEDIDNLIQRFAVSAKIPISEGATRIVLGKLILSAIVSDIVGSKFIIQKMLVPGMRR